MQKFNKVFRGYDPVEVNQFLDGVIKQVELMVKEISVKDAEIDRLKDYENNNKLLQGQIEQLKQNEETLNKSLLMVQKTADDMRMATHKERDIILVDAKRSANRIVNEALLRAEKTEFEANMLRRNINIFKRRLKNIIQSQLEMIEEIDKVEL